MKEIVSIMKSIVWMASLSALFVPLFAEEEEGTHKMLEGMDENGRIPQVTLPADLPNPERWRYIPEGRIQPGNVFERFMATSFAAPLVVSEQDVGSGGGISLTDIDFRNQRRSEFLGLFATYTELGQQRYSLLHQKWLNQVDVPSGGVAQEERGVQLARVMYEKTLTRRFFGTGSESTEDDETSYTDENVQISWQRRDSLFEPGSHWVWILGAKAEWHNLDEGMIKAAAQTKDLYPSLFEESDDYWLGWLEAELAYDNRDSMHSPYSGWNAGLNYKAALVQTDGAIGGLFTGKASYTHTVPPLFHDGGDKAEEHPPTDVLAVGINAKQTHGDLPLYALPTLGGRDSLRGYIKNRFTDQATWHASLEYRFWIFPRGFHLFKGRRIERIGMALFYDVGSVGEDLGEALGNDLKDNWGLSLRISLERGALFRFDYGISEEGSAANFAYGMSF